MAIKMPSVTIAFNEKGITAIQRSQRGIVAMILKEENPEEYTNPVVVYSITDIPETLSDYNKKQIELALMGYQTSPKKILLFVQDIADTYNDLLVELETERFDYLVIPEIAENQTDSIASWVKSMRTNKSKKIKAVLPHCNADNEGIVNFTNLFVQTKEAEYETKDYCSRIAGIITGTPMTISCTYAPLHEVIVADRYSMDEMDEKVGDGELFVFYDGERYKISRGVNSFVTTIQNKGTSFQKIKLIDAMDMIFDDIYSTCHEYYIGKYANSYDNKCLVIGAIQGYLNTLETEGILDRGKNSVFIDVQAQKDYLLSTGQFTQDELANMTEQKIKEANTKDKVFLAANIKILDAIEDITLKFTI